jgi:hypothetical protein
MSRYDFYKGESFTIKSKFDQMSMNIPMTPEMTVVGDRQQRSWRNTWALLIKAVWKGLRRLNYGLLVMAILGFCLQPDVLYGAGVVFYSIMAVNAWIKTHHRRTLQGVVVDEKGRGLTNVIINLSSLDSKRLVAVTPADEAGRFFFTVPAGKYQLTVRKEGYVCMENGRPNMSGELVEAGKKELKVLRMQPYEITTDEWLWQEAETG